MAGRLARRIYATRRWARVRRVALDRDGWRCTECGAAGRLEVHHSYPVAENPTRDHYDLATLRSLCRGCHFAAHPTRNRDRAAWRAWFGALADGAI